MNIYSYPNNPNNVNISIIFFEQYLYQLRAYHCNNKRQNKIKEKNIKAFRYRIHIISSDHNVQRQARSVSDMRETKSTLYLIVSKY